MFRIRMVCYSCYHPFVVVDSSHNNIKLNNQEKIFLFSFFNVWFFCERIILREPKGEEPKPYNMDKEIKIPRDLFSQLSIFIIFAYYKSKHVLKLKEYNLFARNISYILSSFYLLAILFFIMKRIYNCNDDVWCIISRFRNIPCV